MQCHYCDDDADADVAVEKDGVKVGLCKEHFQERLEELQDEGWLEEFKDELQADRFD
jgi:hypothetical protein